MVCSVAYISMVASVAAQEDNLYDLGVSAVTADTGDLIADVEKSKEKVALTPGGGSVIDSEDWTGRIIKPEEIFQFDPGVYARSEGTGNDTRLSVRGSGIQRRFGSRGVSLLLDGAPLNSADGSYYFRAIDPFSISHIETFRGGNGLRFGANQLGGAIQLHQKNGISDPGGELITEYGSYETFRTHLAQGGRHGNWDYRLGYSYSETDGFRDRQDSDTHHFTANIGYHWSDEAVTRAYFLFSDSDALLASSLTEEEFRDDPQQSQPGIDPNTDRDLSTIHVGLNTQWRNHSGEWNFHVGYQYIDFDHLTGFGLFAFNNLVDFDTDEISISLKGHQDYQVGNIQNRFYSSLAADYGRNRVGGFSGFVTPTSGPAAINDREDTSENIKIYFENDTTIAENHHFILGAGYLRSERRRNLGPNDERSIPFNSSDEGVVWRTGYLYETSAVQFFANVSKSFEAAPFSEAEESTITDPQEAITYEIGTRYENDWLKGELTWYYADVRDEFVFEQVGLNSGVFEITNADTTHTGIEAALSIDVSEALEFHSDLQVNFDLSYQYNDFTFDEGPDAGNTIPVISEHVFASRISIGRDTWSTSISADWLPEGLFADNANTLQTSGYAVFDWSAEWEVKSGVKIYGGVNNIFDREFASTVTVNPDSDSFINPGDGRSAFVGVKLAW